jgi:hypothetical protein
MNLPSKYIVFIDNSALQGKNWVESGVEDVLLKYKKDKLIIVEFHIAEVAKNEWLRNYLDKASLHLQKIQGSISSLKTMGSDIQGITLPNQDEILELGAKYLEELNINIIETPYKKIDLKMFVDRAVEHLPPFDEEKDKGIKDAVIAQTVFIYCKNNLKKSDHIIFLCRDIKFIDYLNELFSDFKNFSILDSANAFDSVVKLALDKLDIYLGDEAKKLFYDPYNMGSFYYKAYIGEILKSDYTNNFPDAAKAKAYIESMPSNAVSVGLFSFPKGDIWTQQGNKIEVGETVFIDRNGRTLNWKTTVTYSEQYTVSDETANQIIVTNPSSISHRIKYEVKWSSQRIKGKLTTPKLISVKPVSENKTVNPFYNIQSAVSVSRQAVEGIATSAKIAADFANSVPKFNVGTAINPPSLDSFNKFIGTKLNTKYPYSSPLFEHFWDKPGYNDSSPKAH